MGKSRKNARKKAAAARRPQAASAEAASVKADSTKDGLADDDLVKVVQRKLMSNPGEGASAAESRSRFFADVLVVVVSTAAAAQGLTEVSGVGGGTPDPSLAKIAAVVVWSCIGLFFANRCTEWKATM